MLSVGNDYCHRVAQVNNNERRNCKMAKYFNVNGSCDPDIHYMVDISDKLQQIKAMVDSGAYFTINKARQYGKTTTLNALAELLQKEYEVIYLDFQMLSYGDFESEENFVSAFSSELLLNCTQIPESVKQSLEAYAGGSEKSVTLSVLFRCLIRWCALSAKKIVLLIDEVDTATNNQVFLDFLAQLRAYYLRRRKTEVFQSVILAGVYDIRNIKRKIRPDDEHRTNSPWNIAAKFRVDMSFSVSEIASMLQEYEVDRSVKIDTVRMSELLYEYTAGYPYLVSAICKELDEEISKKTKFSDLEKTWSKEGFLEAVKILLADDNPLFDSLTDKLHAYPELKEIVYRLLFQGQSIAYNPDDTCIKIALMFGLVKVEENNVVIANRIFEIRLYNMFLTSAAEQGTEIYEAGARNKNQFIQKNGHLDMENILTKFVEYFHDIYGDQDAKFYEEDGRRYFMLFLKPIINGTGNYYIEARTRNNERTDMIIDYNGEQYIIEMKIWRGDAYNERGEKQLADYLEYHHLKRGYMLIFNFNKNKKTGIQKIIYGDKLLVEAMV